MPAYDFKCMTCGDVTEVTRPSTDDSPVSCAACGGQTRRLFSPVGVHFKGSGFHATDYRKKGAPGSEAPSCPAAGSTSACESCGKADS